MVLAMAMATMLISNFASQAASTILSPLCDLIVEHEGGRDAKSGESFKNLSA